MTMTFQAPSSDKAELEGDGAFTPRFDSDGLVTAVVTDIRGDQDAVWLKVSMSGHDAACHTGRRSCFYRAVKKSDGGAVLEIQDQQRHFDPEHVYSGHDETGKR
ncbi:MAG: hypothetical protein EOP17_07740 [Rhizobiaceae bacterium]|nr:MAG: hypothetical protein EOP17_07740 [Rhizobiaceae bacterium]